jgi:radical SAM superfamily enzyme YgiQ (UPF0313 family)
MQTELIPIRLKNAGTDGGGGNGAGVAQRPVRDTGGSPGAKKRVLLTTAYGPYPTHWGTAPSDLLGARLARGHKMLAMATEFPTLPLYLIAENLSNPCTVLDFPRWDSFVKEVRQGYDVVAIELKSIHVRRVVEMMKAIREMSPGTQIVVGGYGVGALRDGMPGDTEGLAQHILDDADYICRTEGVRAMREFLGDGPVDRPITQYDTPHVRVRPYRGETQVEVRLPAILVSLGCPSACDFCNTSAFFHHKKQVIATPAQVYEFMKHHQRRIGEDRVTFILFDEDLFLDPEYVRELGRLIRSDRKTWGFRWITFGSVKALEQFTPRELRECGVEGIWIGVESGLVEHGKETGGYDKRGTQNPVELFEQLRHHGIETIGSMILGLDFHTPCNIEQDIDYFVSLKPTFYQIGPIRPCPGTKLFRQMRKKGRITEDYNWEHFHLWEETSHKPMHFEQGGIRKYYDLAHEKLRTQVGSPVLQIFEANVLAHETLRHADSEFLRYQADVSLERARQLHPVIQAMALNPASPQVLERVRGLLARLEPHLKGDPLSQRLFRRVAGRVVGWRMGLSEGIPDAPMRAYSPPTERVEYAETPSQRARASATSRPRPGRAAALRSLVAAI